MRQQEKNADDDPNSGEHPAQCEPEATLGGLLPSAPFPFSLV